MPVGLSDREKSLVSQAFGMTDISGLEHLTPQIRAQIGLQVAESGRPTTVQEMARLGEALQAGIPVFQMAQTLTRISGAPITGPSGYLDQAIVLASGDETQRARLQAGIQLMGQTPGIRRMIEAEQPRWRPVTPKDVPPAQRMETFAVPDISYAGGRGVVTGVSQVDVAVPIPAAQRPGMVRRETEEEKRVRLADEFADIAEGRYGEQFLQRATAIEQMRAVGLAAPVMDIDRYREDAVWTDAQRTEAFRQNQLMRMQTSMQGRLIGMGATDQQLEGLVPSFAAMGAGGMGLANQIIGMQPITTTGLAMGGAFDDLTFRGTSLNMLAGTMDIRGGVQTGLPWGTTGMQRGDVGARQMGINVWGAAAMQGQGVAAQAIRAASDPRGVGETFMGRDVPESMQGMGGMRLLQWVQTGIQRDAARAAAGNQMAMLELQGRYQPQFWAIQDQQRALSHEQAMFGFQMQERQFEMQGTQFYENLGLQRYGQVQQRGWRREDWAMQDQMRSMQWGWKQEDFQENVRFMTGRQRRQAETGMERETVMFNLQGAQIETQRERQAEIWRLEDERYQMTIQHFEESRDLQEENMEKQQEFYFEGKRLQDEMIKLQREYWKEMHALQLAAAGAQAGYAEDLNDVQDRMTELALSQKDSAGLWQVAQNDSDLMINAIIKGLNYVIMRAPAGLRSILDGLLGGDVQLIDAWEGAGGGGSNGENGGGCFIAGTMILMADGNSMAIENITLGDRVITFGEDNEFSEGEVKWVMEPIEKTVYVLNDTIQVSGEHPFWTPDGWVKATDLASGDRYYAFDETGIHLEELTSVWYSPEAVTVYNFHVEGDETYIADGAMVHNKVIEDAGATFVPTVGSNGGGGDTKIVVMIGNEKLEEYVIKAVKNDLEHA